MTAAAAELAAILELAAALEPVIRRVVREELRAVGLRPPAPAGPGARRWDAERDAWEPVSR